jgi:hypothetical protein
MCGETVGLSLKAPRAGSLTFTRQEDHDACSSCACSEAATAYIGRSSFITDKVLSVTS